VLFSEPKIPQCSISLTIRSISLVSVLFSEPKIPQSPGSMNSRPAFISFSALQRAENSSMVNVGGITVNAAPFQCSSAMPATREYVASFADVSVLFSEPKIPQ